MEQVHRGKLIYSEPYSLVQYAVLFVLLTLFITITSGSIVFISYQLTSNELLVNMAVVFLLIAITSIPVFEAMKPFFFPLRVFENGLAVCHADLMNLKKDHSPVYEFRFKRSFLKWEEIESIEVVSKVTEKNSIAENLEIVVKKGNTYQLALSGNTMTDLEDLMLAIYPFLKDNSIKSSTINEWAVEYWKEKKEKKSAKRKKKKS